MKPYFFKILYKLKKLLLLNYKRCLLCFKVVEESLIKDGICKSCFEKIFVNKGFFCPRCGKRYEGGVEGVVCKDCRELSLPWNRLVFFGFYKGLLREAIISYKFRKNFYMEFLLGNLLIKAYEERLSDYRPDVIVPVPIFRKNLKFKGFNHTLEIARPLSKHLKTKLDHKALLKIKNTKPQVELDHKRRWENLKGAFWADPKRVSGKKILLVDDVFTTGATAYMCSKELKKQNAKEINIIVIARSVD